MALAIMQNIINRTTTNVKSKFFVVVKFIDIPLHDDLSGLQPIFCLQLFCWPTNAQYFVCAGNLSLRSTGSAYY